MTGCSKCWLDEVPDLLALASEHPEKFPFLLESTAQGSLNDHSILMYAGNEHLLALSGTSPQGPGTGTDFFERLESWYQAEKTEPCTSTGRMLPFSGGWFLYLGYEMAAEIEGKLDLPANQNGIPDAIAWRCPGAVLVLHGRGNDQPDRAVAVAETPEVLEAILACLKMPPQTVLQEPATQATGSALVSFTEENSQRFKNSVDRIHQYLLDGDVFQVNISRPWKGKFSEKVDPLDIYQALRKTNPAPFAGLMCWANSTILSSSPERLVQIRDGEVQTRPVAGTRPRGADEERDMALIRELIGNDKERAEHIMLIDLERNDLGRVCEPGSVEVDELMVIESYAHVHHIVSNVRGKLTPGASPVDTLKAVFPGGTITGCPKVRCMEIIAELEGEARSFYTGSMGYLGTDGSLDMNILIRSMLLQDNEISFRTGAGIVADSIAEMEVGETRDKARGLLLALNSTLAESKDV